MQPVRGVVGCEDPGVETQQLLQQAPGLVVTLRPDQQHREVVHRAEGVRMVGTHLLTAHVEGVAH